MALNALSSSHTFIVGRLLTYSSASLAWTCLLTAFLSTLYGATFAPFFFFLMIRRPPRSPLFPSTPLSRSREVPVPIRRQPATALPGPKLDQPHRLAGSGLGHERGRHLVPVSAQPRSARPDPVLSSQAPRSEEHTSELQSRSDLVCRLLLEK